MREIETKLKMVATAELDAQIEKELKKADPKGDAMASIIMIKNDEDGVAFLNTRIIDKVDLS